MPKIIFIIYDQLFKVILNGAVISDRLPEIYQISALVTKPQWLL